MIVSETKVRVRYGETDQMGYCYYGNYAQFYEVGRVEAMRDLGFPYQSLEEKGVLLPVSDFQIKYLRPAYYDELLTIRTFIREVPGVKFKFDYETYNEAGELLNTGHTTLVFVSKESGKPMRGPEELLSAVQSGFS